MGHNIHPMRGPTKLRAFELADALTLATYKATQDFPREEACGLPSPMRRAAVSVASNIVEVALEAPRMSISSFSTWPMDRHAKSNGACSTSTLLTCYSLLHSCGGRNRTCVPALNRRLPVPARAPPQKM